MSLADKSEQTASDELLPDAVADHPLWRFAPAPLRPFVQLARLDRPTGWWLLLLPCWQGSALAAASLGHAPDFHHLTLFFIGAVAMRGAGSTYNDIVDRKIDAKVERTRGRPLASGRVSVRAATVFLVVQCLVGLAVLLSFNLFTILLGLLSPLIVLVYPFAKRFTSWPQAILGFAFAYGALLGWTAQTGSLGWPAVWLYLAAIFWTIGFDTIYALQDKRDDSIAGVRSTALLFGERVRLAVGALYLCSAALAQLAVSAAHAGGATQIGVEIGVLAYAAHLAWQVARTDAKIAPSVALMLFRSNRDAGLLLFAGFAAQGFLSAYS